MYLKKKKKRKENYEANANNNNNNKNACSVCEYTFQNIFSVLS